MSREIEDNNITQNESTRNANLDRYIRNNNIGNYRRFNATFFIIIIMSIALIIILIVLCISFSTKNNNNRKKNNNNGNGKPNNNNNGKPNITGKETQRTDVNTEKTDGNIVIESDTSQETEIICDSGFFLPKDNYSKCFKCAIDNCDKCNGNKNSNICTSCKKGFKTIYEENKKVIKACEFFCEQGEKEKCFKCNETDNKCLSCNSGYYIPEDDDSKNDCQKCSITNCKECKGTRNKNLCINCDSNLIPYYENNIIISCNNCSIGKDEKCLTCGKIKNECGSCNPGYILKDGNCIINYAFKAEYYTDQNNINIPLINNSYINKINQIIIDNEKKEIVNEYIFVPFSGNHTIYFFINSVFDSFEYMFYKNKNIKSIFFSEIINTTKITNINNMFSGCTSLTSIDISNFNIQNIKDMNSLFFNCYSLESINIGNVNTENLIDMSYMFYNCSSLNLLNLSKINTKNVINMSHIFAQCSSLKSIDITHFNTHKVKDMSYMFYNCSSLNKLNLSNFNTENAIDMNHMFSHCSLTSINISNFNTQNVKDMSYMFSDNNNLISYKFYNFTNNNLINISNIFSNCLNLESVDFSNFKTNNIIDMSYLFSGC